jgi:hypothetical protein
MRDLIAIIIGERLTLLKGLIVSFLLVFPFTFLPIISDGLTWSNIHARFPMSTLYALGFSLAVVVAAVIQNYNDLVDRKYLLDKPAFAKLDFHGRLDGVGSIVNELETFLLGKIGRYYFRLNIINPDKNNFQVEIVPVIDIEEDQELKAKLRQQLGFTDNRFFGVTMNATVADLENENFLLNKLTEIEKTLSDLDARQPGFAENELLLD